ncbi:DinB family protein [Auraticoccus monumenti]|uniref:DinB superfamily protein n=1 Tax=Auraticoccus monumenti TaxID=675864 RepID=A0A1G6Z602_9ACTN|nr:DinB family protein [Auraticoccus monumenti]SDD97713.1 Protein of unknown function [Auraticoccus monumenti]
MSRLVTQAELAGEEPDAAVSLRHELVLDTGYRVLLLDDRGWAGGPWAHVTVAAVQETARVCVGPDEAFGEHTPESMAADHWAELAATARRQGVEVDAAALSVLPHDVLLSPRLLGVLRRRARDTPGATTASGPVVAGRQDTRDDGPMTGDERAVLDHWVELYRETVLLKIAGLDADQLARRASPPSSMSLLGVVRHLTEVEAYWLRVVLLDEQDVPDYYCVPDSPDGDFDDATAATAVADVAAYLAELEVTRRAAGGWRDLTTPALGRRRGRPVNLRWILTHLIEEYARHLGHMDLLREAVDGRTGY